MGVPDADADNTDATWIEVRKNRDMSARAAKRNSRLPRGLASDTGRSSLSDQPNLVDSGESVGTPDSTLTSRTGVTPRNAKFTELILLPRAIRVKDTNAIVASAFAHFNTNRPSEGYDKVGGLSHTDIWVSGNADWVRSLSNEYKEMKALGLCEEEFASFAKEQFLRRSPRYLPDSDDRQWRGERMLQLVNPPKENTHWRKPPVLDSTHPIVEWSWDIRPDCAYWLSLKGFNPRYRFQIQNCAYVRDWITCPYFTVEFKRDGVSEDAAIAQVAAAGSMALYNRYKLREAAREARPGLEMDSNIRHYALTFVGSKFVFWVLEPHEPRGDERWHGCTMTRLVGADCTDVYGVEELVDWINEIHRWGVAAHGPSCERDIKAVLNLGGVRTSDIHAVLS
ncbi:uncharacterized protein F5Z01DRAFT_683752 [Emericellopsis atlantica]|uniref:Uncharacterized protein n=1 Tax=Emericellopsis atlantica TaxID=2614577 RepID=A0A9P7ZF88_9HYPO|nr:uncharacterized protein F5Z01DRAFT_683752 [Emericellopsis atlantica]KAG9250611.1 hypothetical protein F5Z01DRAFT_683752 [Emericellopsis atlantica]